MDQLDYVELLYNDKGMGVSVICHYASGRTTTRRYSRHHTDRYIMANAMCNGLYWALRPADCLDRSAATIMGRPS